jgi:hypothetical protein
MLVMLRLGPNIYTYLRLSVDHSFLSRSGLFDSSFDRLLFDFARWNNSLRNTW